MKNRIFKYILGIVIAPWLFISCEEQNNILGELRLVEFNNSGVYNVFIPDEPNFVEPLRVVLVSSPLNEDVTVNFEITLPTNPVYDIAVENTHYQIPKSVIIPAGQVYADLPLTGIFDGFSGAGDIREFQINMTTVTNSSLFEKTSLVVRMQLTCESDIAGTYLAEMDGDFGDSQGGSAAPYSGLSQTVVLTAIDDDGTYSIDDMTFGLYPQGYGDIMVPGRIKDECNQISDLGDTDHYGDPFTITGTVNGDGTIDISWSNTYGDTGTGVLTLQ